MPLRLVRVTNNRAIAVNLVEVLHSVTGISDILCAFLPESASEGAILASEGHWIVKRFSVHLLDTVQTIGTVRIEGLLVLWCEG